MLLGIEFQILTPVNLIDFWVLCSLNNGVCSIGVVRIFVWGRGANLKSRAMTSSEIFERGSFCWNKDAVEWKIRSRGLFWHLTRILLMGEGLNQK